MIFTGQNFSDQLAFDFIDEIHKKEIAKLIENKNGSSFTEDANKKIKKVLSKYDLEITSTDESGSEGKSKISVVNDEVEAVKKDMKKNIKQVILNIDEAQIIDEKANNIADQSEVFKNLAHDYQRSTWWKGNIFKIALIIIIAIAGIYLTYWAFSD